jgi:hypothetical protein
MNLKVKEDRKKSLGSVRALQQFIFNGLAMPVSLSFPPQRQPSFVAMRGLTPETTVAEGDPPWRRRRFQVVHWLSAWWSTVWMARVLA